MTARSLAPASFMPVYIEDPHLGGRRDLISVALEMDVSHLLAAGLRFPRLVGREVAGGGVQLERIDGVGRRPT